MQLQFTAHGYVETNFKYHDSVGVLCMGVCLYDVCLSVLVRMFVYVCSYDETHINRHHTVGMYVYVTCTCTCTCLSVSLMYACVYLRGKKKLVYASCVRCCAW